MKKEGYHLKEEERVNEGSLLFKRKGKGEQRKFIV